MRHRLFILFSLLALTLTVWACGAKKPPVKEPAIAETVTDAGADEDADAEPPAPKSLYERMGKREAIAKVVDTFMKNMMANKTVAKRFAKLKGPKLDAFKESFTDFVCKETGGDCEYKGKDMKEAHKGMKITEAEWNATVEALGAALEEHGVGKEEQADLVAALGKMREDIAPAPPAKK
ncbi:MAG: group 1 truncated hemoglobin [Myxococcales bacterium]|nr:group 1 truncated hemoglobin [Myxococcales bacterium]